jgi:hypothetical protein
VLTNWSMISNMAQRVGTLVALAFLVALPWRAQAQDSGRTPDAAVQAGSDFYFRQFVQPLIQASQERAIRDYHNPVLYDPFHAPAPAEPTPDRNVRRHQAAGMLLVANERPPAVETTPGGEWDDWNDPVRREMFRVYFP